MKKRCPRCKVLRAERLFVDEDVERKQCASCRETGRERFRRTYKKSPRKIINQVKARRAALPPELRRAQSRTAQQNYFEKNPDALKRKRSAYRKRNLGKFAARSRDRHAHIKRATPKWADLDKIAAIYALAAQLRAGGHDVHVEHVVPLRGRTVSGLHVETNLKIRGAHFNLKKSNKHDADNFAGGD